MTALTNPFHETLLSVPGVILEIISWYCKCHRTSSSTTTKNWTERKMPCQGECTPFTGSYPIQVPLSQESTQHPTDTLGAHTSVNWRATRTHRGYYRHIMWDPNYLVKGHWVILFDHLLTIFLWNLHAKETQIPQSFQSFRWDFCILINLLGVHYKYKRFNNLKPWFSAQEKALRSQRSQIRAKVTVFMSHPHCAL